MWPIGAFVQLYADCGLRIFALIELLKFLPQSEGPVTHSRVVSGGVLSGSTQGFDADQILSQFVAMPGDLHLANVSQEAFQLIRPSERVAPKNGVERRLFLFGGHRLGPVGESLVHKKAWVGENVCMQMLANVL